MPQRRKKSRRESTTTTSWWLCEVRMETETLYFCSPETSRNSSVGPQKLTCFSPNLKWLLSFKSGCQPRFQDYFDTWCGSSRNRTKKLENPGIFHFHFFPFSITINLFRVSIRQKSHYGEKLKQDRDQIEGPF
jgi:hypothetical protein